MRESSQNDPVKDEKKAGKRNIASHRCNNFYRNTLGQRWLGEDHVGGSGYDHGEFEDTDAFYVQPVLKLKSFDPEAMVSRPGGWTSGI